MQYASVIVNVFIHKCSTSVWPANKVTFLLQTVGAGVRGGARQSW